MLASKSIIGFIPTKNFERAKAFYAGTLRLPLISQDAFALVFESGGNMVRVVKVGEYSPFPFTLIGWQATRMRQDVLALSKRGVQFERFPGMNQDDLGVWTAPGGAQVAWFKDPDGNVLSLSYHGKSTKKLPPGRPSRSKENRTALRSPRHQKK